MNEFKGYLKIEAFQANQAMPVPNAQVIIYKTINNEKQVLHNLITDSDGTTPLVELDTVNSSYSMTPGEVRPYSVYNIEIIHPGYQQKYFVNVPVFPGITTIQRVAMQPVLQNSNSTEYIFGSESNTL